MQTRKSKFAKSENRNNKPKTDSRKGFDFKHKKSEGKDTFSYLRKTNENVLNDRDRNLKSTRFNNSFGKSSKEVIEKDRKANQSDNSKRTSTEREENKKNGTSHSHDFAKKTKHQSAPSDESLGIRLNRYIANCGVCARREADNLIQQGEIYVNGKIMTDFSYRVQPGDSVRYGSKLLKREKFVYILLNKPKDFLTTTEDPEGRKSVMDLVKDATNVRLYPVGRLDRNTTGLLLLTNDGDLTDKLMHPSYKAKKIYQVDLDKPFSDTDLQKIRQGVVLEDGPMRADDVEIVSPDRKRVGIEIHSGRNRIVRRIFEHLGYNIEKLDRVMYAGLTKKDLPRGTWRHLTELEITTLKHLRA
ncbi:MAG TPA: ribosomal large subunit pseudouridine synthase B [Cytophagales bacterium]|nr:ribosomal large subunit pseudouridine synthase B [Cytophagales bacterium]